MDVSEVQSNPTKSPWIATVLVDKKPVNFKLDSGADVTVVPYNTFLSIDLKIQLKPTDKVLLGPCNYRMNSTVRENSQPLSLTTKLPQRKPYTSLKV